MRRPITVAVAALLLVGVAASSSAAPTFKDATPYTCDSQEVKQHRLKAKGIAHAMFAKRKWRTTTPAKPEQRRWFRWHIECIYDPPTDAKLRQYKAEHKTAFYRYHNTFGPYTPWGKYAIPAYIVQCESGSEDWHAYNESSGAAGRYQELAMHGRPWPVNSWNDKLVHTEIAYDLSDGGHNFGAWSCA